MNLSGSHSPPLAAGKFIIDDADSRPDLETVLNTAVFYGLNNHQAKQIVQEVVTAVDDWREAARKMCISRADLN